MGHRVTHHGSKCRNPHGHRYEVEAVCEGDLHLAGEQEGMVLDFGFLKEAMMELIHDPCDHGFCIWCNDAQMVEMFEPHVDVEIPQAQAQACTNKYGMKLYVVPFVPTAENLARHWHDKLAPEA